MLDTSVWFLFATMIPFLVLYSVLEWSGSRVEGSVAINFIIWDQVGENGTGKSTLLKLLTDEISPLEGYRQAHR